MTSKSPQSTARPSLCGALGWGLRACKRPRGHGGWHADGTQGWKPGSESSCWLVRFNCQRCGAFLVTNGATYWCSNEKCLMDAKPTNAPAQRPPKDV